MVKLSIIIVNYNTEYLLKSCLESLYQGYKSKIVKKTYQIIVVDNYSKENPAKMIRNNFPDVIFIRNATNYGFAKANNIGIKRSSGEVILLLNPDTVVYSQTLVHMYDFLLRYPDVGIATCKVLLSNGEIDDASHRGFPTPWRAFTNFLGLSKIFMHSILFNGYHLGYRAMDKIHQIDACVGAFLMIKRNVGEQVNWLSEDYFWYGDDLDLCFRVKQIGYKIMYVPDVSIMHYKGASSGIKKHSLYISQADSSIKVAATKARFEAMRIFYKKYYEKKYPKWITNLVFLGINIKQEITQIFL